MSTAVGIDLAAYSGGGGGGDDNKENYSKKLEIAYMDGDMDLIKEFQQKVRSMVDNSWLYLIAIHNRREMGYGLHAKQFWQLLQKPTSGLPLVLHEE